MAEAMRKVKCQDVFSLSGTMARGHLGRTLFLLALVHACCTGYWKAEAETRPWLNRRDVVRQFPLEVQKSFFKNLLQAKNVDMSGDAPATIDTQYPEMVEFLVNGAIDVFFSGNPWVKQVLAPVIVRGITYLIGIFGRKKVYIPNMPPLVNCSPNIERPQDKGRLTAAVSWVEPVGYDIEDGIVPATRRGKAPGSRFHGEEIVEYRVYDKEGRSDMCIFFVTIKVVKCPPFALQTHRRNTCHGPSYYGDECTFSCDTGYTLVGRPVLTCNVDGNYDWMAPNCERICHQPQLPTGGVRWDCTNGFNTGSVCTLYCAKGHRNVGADASITCQANLTWTVEPGCTDIIAPTITNCPGYTMEYADKGKRSTRVRWDRIRATDNRESVTVKQVKGKASGSVFTEGAHEVSYEAVDNAGLKDTCTFYVNVKALQCLVPMVQDKKVEHDCENGYLYGFPCSLSCTYGYTLQGASSMSCEREEGNMTWKYLGSDPTCVPKECPKPPLPLGGTEWQCSNDYIFNSECMPECRHGYIPARTKISDGSGWRDSYVKCSGDGTWTGTAECTADVWEIMQAIDALNQTLSAVQSTLGRLLRNNKSP